jgi:hypothetical protein
VVVVCAVAIGHERGRPRGPAPSSIRPIVRPDRGA